jgi:CCR4-NOT transcription complex subunit 1
MRNLILSAFPRNMRLPGTYFCSPSARGSFTSADSSRLLLGQTDPFTPNLKVDLLPEISQPPRILSKYTAALTANKTFKQEVDSYLKTGQPYTFLLELRAKLFLPQGQALVGGTRYNAPLINALVLYVGAQAVAQLHPTTSQPPAPINQSAPMNIFQHLALDLDTEGRYLFLNAIANQLRYPNNHTHYFTSVLLYLFAEANQGQADQTSQEIIQEQITRVLLERLIVNRPHPWGLLITFIELIKNPRYNFWSHSFTRCAPEIERLFESVARSCMGPGPGGAPKSDRPGLVDK